MFSGFDAASRPVKRRRSYPDVQLFNAILYSEEGPSDRGADNDACSEARVPGRLVVLSHQLGTRIGYAKRRDPGSYLSYAPALMTRSPQKQHTAPLRGRVFRQAGLKGPWQRSTPGATHVLSTPRI